MRWKCTCAYDGGGFNGWQRQPNGGSVQDVLEAALGEVLSGPVLTHGSGRTDAGVHARGQVFHFDADWRHGPERLLRALHTKLPPELALRGLRPAAAGFHARYSATGKRYCYRIYRGRAGPFETRFQWSLSGPPPDIAAMRAAAAQLVGEHDFTALSARAKRGTNEPEPNPVKRLWQLEVRESGRRISITAEGSGFLYKMMRSIAGALCDAGRGRIDAADLARILASGKRTQAVVTAPARGLCLEKVYYRKRPNDAGRTG